MVSKFKNAKIERQFSLKGLILASLIIMTTVITEIILLLIGQHYGTVQFRQNTTLLNIIINGLIISMWYFFSLMILFSLLAIAFVAIFAIYWFYDMIWPYKTEED